MTVAADNWVGFDRSKNKKERSTNPKQEIRF